MADGNDHLRRDEQGPLTRRRFLQGAAAAGGALTFASFLAACGGSSSSSSETAAAATTSAATGVSVAEPGTTAAATVAEGEPVKGGTIRVGINDGGGSESMNPLFLPTYMETARACQLYDRLYQGASDGTNQPWLADSVESNADATVWKLTLRSGVTFHDGKPLTADDVLWTIGWIQDPASKSEATPIVEPIDLTASKKISDTEIELHLKRPVGALTDILAAKAFLIVPDGKKDDWERPNGTGPFKLVSWSPGQETVLEPNPDYWGDGPYADQVVLSTISDPTQRLNALLSGQIEAMSFIDFVQAQAQQENPDLQLVRASGSLCIPMYMQIDADPFSDVKVREAMRLAVDREEMVKNVLLGFGQVGNDVFGIGYPSYNNELPQRPYDPEKAKSLLAEAGMSNLKVTLPSSTAIAGLLESATAFKEQASAAGITIDVQKIPADSYWANDKYLKVPFYQTNWSGSFDVIAPQALQEDAPYNETHWFRPEFTAELLRAQGIPDEAERNGVYFDLQEQIYNEGGYIIWGFQDIVDAASAKVQGITTNPVFSLGYFMVKDWWLAA